MLYHHLYFTIILSAKHPVQMILIKKNTSNTSLAIKVKTLTGRTIAINMEKNSTIEALKNNYTIFENKCKNFYSVGTPKELDIYLSSKKK